MFSTNDKDYDIIDIANWFHNLSHLSYDLKPIKNSTFDPNNNDYVTSIAVFIALPVVALVIILIIYLIFSILMCICCIDDKKRKSNCIFDF